MELRTSEVVSRGVKVSRSGARVEKRQFRAGTTKCVCMCVCARGTERATGGEIDGKRAVDNISLE